MVASFNRSCFGYFHFKLFYPDLSGSNEWTQTSNPVLQNVVTGYKGECFTYYNAKQIKNLKIKAVYQPFFCSRTPKQKKRKHTYLW